MIQARVEDTQRSKASKNSPLMRTGCSRIGCGAGAVFLFLLLSPPSFGQLSFTSAINLALKNSPKVRDAESDLRKAESGLAVMKDIYVPSVVIGGGVGDSYGITLSVPTIFTLNAQSLVFSVQQRSYIRAAHSDLTASRLALAEAREEVEEDTAITYVSLANSQKVVEALAEQYGFATRLVSIVQDRVNAKLDSDLELLRARRVAVQIRLQQLQAEDDRQGMRAHLAELADRAPAEMTPIPESIPTLPTADALEAALNRPVPDTPGLLAAEANATSKALRAHGDAQYTWRPQVTFGAQYGRISPINDVSSYYNLHGNYNSANAGVQIQFPLIDKVRKEAAKQSFLDASRAAMDLQGIRNEQSEGRRKLLRAVAELGAREELAELDFGIAQNQLKSTADQMHAASGGPPLTPKEEQNTHIEERQRYLDLLDAKLQLAKTQISLLRQIGSFDSWLNSSADISTAAEKP